MSGFNFVVSDGCEYCGLSYNGDTCGHAGRTVEPQYFVSIDKEDVVTVESVAGYHWDKIDELSNELDYPVDRYAWIGAASVVESLMQSPLFDAITDIPPVQYADDRDENGGLLVWNEGERLKRIYNERDA